MPETFVFDPRSFKGMEHIGWEGAAPVYGNFLGVVTSNLAGSLLDATGVSAGTRVLEVCCGPGYGAGAAAARGATAVGVDFAQAMVEVAYGNFPDAAFQQGAAEALPFGDASFDAVICGFGLRHLADPDKAIAEAHRVLVSGGQYAFTDWCGPEKVKFFGLVLGAIQTHGALNVPLSPAPPLFRFSDPAACVAALCAAGFVEPRVTELPLVYCPPTAEQVLEFTQKAAPRMQMILALQTPGALERIHQAIVEGATRLEKAGRIEIAMPTVLASAHKP
jgi:ubiquinone/menaquinone biosynthesis C-methylase UbiE